jgi:hypothetical protein
VKTVCLANISPEAVALLKKGWTTKVVLALALHSCGEDELFKTSNIIFREHWRGWIRECVVKVWYQLNIVISRKKLPQVAMPENLCTTNLQPEVSGEYSQS